MGSQVFANIASRFKCKPAKKEARVKQEAPFTPYSICSIQIHKLPVLNCGQSNN
jgi:hypothetical protein